MYSQSSKDMDRTVGEMRFSVYILSPCPSWLIKEVRGGSESPEGGGDLTSPEETISGHQGTEQL